MDFAIYFLLVLSGLILVVSFLIYKKSSGGQSKETEQKIQEISALLSKIELNLKEDFRINREENSAISKENRTELNNSLKDFTIELRTKFDEIKKEQSETTTKTVEQLEKITLKIEEKLSKLTEENKKDNFQMRESIEKSFKTFGESFDKNVASFNNLQKEKFASLEEKQNKLVEGTEKKLEEMRLTVDEKLQKTLSERLNQSFELVGKQLENVQKGLGEMQTIAQDVGGLKKVLGNVKMSGGFGEVQLGMLLEQILAPDQYDRNVKTKKGSGDNVEYAIKLPGRENNDSVVYLPVDAKFPKDVYLALQEAYEDGDIDKVTAAKKLLDTTVKKMAKDISEKYLDPPNTTDFGIMFLPFEGIYAEIVRQAGLLEELQRKYKIVITGPTTLAAILHSLQMGFRTLAIQQRSSEVWEVLGAVKTEFSKFGVIMEKAQNNIQTGLNQLDDVMGRRTRAIQRRLKNVESIDEAKSQNIIEENLDLDSDDDDN